MAISTEEAVGSAAGDGIFLGWRVGENRGTHHHRVVGPVGDHAGGFMAAACGSHLDFILTSARVLAQGEKTWTIMMSSGVMSEGLQCAPLTTRQRCTGTQTEIRRWEVHWTKPENMMIDGRPLIHRGIMTTVEEGLGNLPLVVRTHRPTCQKRVKWKKVRVDQARRITRILRFPQKKTTGDALSTRSQTGQLRRNGLRNLGSSLAAAWLVHLVLHSRRSERDRLFICEPLDLARDLQSLWPIQPF